MKILLLNQNWFKQEFIEAGHEVMTAGREGHHDFVIATPYIRLDTLLSEIKKTFSPDRLVFYDDSVPILFPGFEICEVPTLFYSVDTHHHLHLHQAYAHTFDALCIAQRDYQPCFPEKLGVSWLPLWASRVAEPVEPKKYGAVFVGTIDPSLNPDRVLFLEKLAQKAPLLCTTGSFPHYFSRAEIALNQTVRGDLNFRVFEALAAGPLLISERTAHGLTDLFIEGRHLVLYERGDVEGAAELIHRFLQDKGNARAIAAEGRQEVLRRHTATQRAHQLLVMIEQLGSQPKRRRHVSAAINFLALHKALFGRNSGAQHIPLILAMQALAQACLQSETLSLREFCTGMTIGKLSENDGNGFASKKLMGDLSAANPDLPLAELIEVQRLSASEDSREDATRELAGVLGGDSDEARVCFDILKQGHGG